MEAQTGQYFDDTERYIDALFELNARRLYPRFDAALKARGK